MHARRGGNRTSKALIVSTISSLTTCTGARDMRKRGTGRGKEEEEVGDRHVSEPCLVSLLSFVWRWRHHC